MVRHPPGRLMYEAEMGGQVVKVWEIDGKIDKLYAQKVCLLGKLFVE
jgi:hypothetical protein